MKIETEQDLETAKNMSFAPDQLAELEVGCEIWDVSGENQFGQSWTGTMCRWPNGRGAFESGSDSNWGDWEGIFLRLDDTTQDWKIICIDHDGGTWFKVRVDFEYSADVFWGELRENHPDIAERFGDTLTTESVMIHEDELEVIKTLTGWADGPEFARNPVFLI